MNSRPNQGSKFWNRGSGFPIPVLLFLITLSSCATYTHKLGTFRDHVARENYENALKDLEHAREGPDRLLYLVENGLIAHHQGRFSESNRYFETAENLAEDLFTRSLSREAAALVTNDAVRAYRGEDFEHVFINYYRALNYWYLGMPEDALVECRKANLKLHRFAAAADYDPTYKNDAFIHYVTGLIYEATGELNDAYISYKDAEKAYETYREMFDIQPPPTLRDDLARVSRALGYPDAPDAHLISLDAPGARADGELILFSETGFIPQKIQEEINLPLFEDEIKNVRDDERDDLSRKVARRYYDPYPPAQDIKYWLRVALPVYRDASSRTRAIRLSASGQTVPAVPAENLSAVAHITFRDKLPGILARTVSRNLAKYLAAESAREKSKILGFFANLFTATTEVADTRSWVSLPRSIHIGRLRLPPGEHTLTVETLDAEGHIIETKTIPGVRIRPGARTFLNTRTYD